MGNTQDDLIARLMAGEFGPWAGQGFVPGGITILRPEGFWETITAVPGDADLTQSVQGAFVNVSGLLDPTERELVLVDNFLRPGIPGLPITLGLAPRVGFGGSVQASRVSAGTYTYLNFVETELGNVRMTVGLSNGSTGPLSPIRMGSLMAVDKDGNKWLPVVRMQPYGGGMK